MTLRDLIGEGAPAVEVSALAYASERVTPGTLFFCVPGLVADGHDFAREAAERGAVALVCERPLGLAIPEIVVPDARAAMAPAAARFYGDPSSELAVVGVTGTNGKTTTTFLTRSLLEAAGIGTGLLGTVTSIVGGQAEAGERTTPEAIDLAARLRRMADAGDRACVMEVSSHALALGRCEGVHFSCQVFTNLTQDHLDFHQTMDDYFRAKRRLFGGPGASIVNIDDHYGRRIADEVEGAVSYAIEVDAEYRAHDIELDGTGASFRCETPAGALELRTRLPGRFNVYNALAAVAAARVVGVDLELIGPALALAEPVRGRFEPVEEGQDFTVIVDYAHSPDSLANALRAARALTTGRVHVVFGAGGDRDRAKRPLMGEAARALADRVIVTSDNPRSEDPDAIIDEILAGSGEAAERERDRRRAIALAIETAAPADVVLIAGKGHEQGQELAGGRVEPFDDVAVARAALRRVGGASA